MPPGGRPIWIPGAYNLSGTQFSAVSYCRRGALAGDPTTLRSPAIGFAGGLPWLVQYGYGVVTRPASTRTTPATEAAPGLH